MYIQHDHTRMAVIVLTGSNFLSYFGGKQDFSWTAMSLNLTVHFESGSDLFLSDGGIWIWR